MNRVTPAAGSPEGWRRQAACVGKPTEWFFPEQSEGGGQYAKARLLCAGCPVRAECEAEARADHIPHGMWGGLTAQQRGSYRSRRVAS